MNSANNNKAIIAKITIALYIRMLITVAISLYTSRAILGALGEADFGIYNVVGGVVILMGILNSSMAGATSRFLSYEIGQNNQDRLKKTFMTSIELHLFIAFVVLVLGETVGLWFVNNKLVIPEERQTAAFWVYQSSLIASLLSIIQVPYTALIISKEKMDVYAALEIIGAFFKLGIVFLIFTLSYDRLIIYGILVLLVAAIVYALYFLYCKIKFRDCFSVFGFHKKIALSMLGFSGWDLYGNACVLVRQQGTNVLLNMFFGVVLNAANGIATQASGIVTTFVSNITMAFRPQIVKSYASGHYAQMQDYISLSIALCMFFIQIITVPIYLNIDTIMELWLGNVPEYAGLFCQYLLVANAAISINYILSASIQATGNIKKLSLITGTLYLVPLFIAYIYFHYKSTPVFAYQIWAFFSFIILACNFILLKLQIPDIKIISILKFILRPFVCVAITTILTFYINKLIGGSLLSTFIQLVLNVILLALVIYILWVKPVYNGNLKKIFE